jgi:hypothetical protein
MIDGLAQENLTIGTLLKSATVTASTALSGADLLVASATIDATELAANSVDTSELAASAVTPAKVSSATYKAGSATLSSGSRWVTFETAFADAEYFIHVTAKNSVRNAVEPLGIGSKAVGSFLALGSVDSVRPFDWIAMYGKP